MDCKLKVQDVLIQNGWNPALISKWYQSLKKVIAQPKTNTWTKCTHTNKKNKVGLQLKLWRPGTLKEADRWQRHRHSWYNSALSNRGGRELCWEPPWRRSTTSVKLLVSVQCAGQCGPSSGGAHRSEGSSWRSSRMTVKDDYSSSTSRSPSPTVSPGWQWTLFTCVMRRRYTLLHRRLRQSLHILYQYLSVSLSSILDDSFSAAVPETSS